MLLQGLPLTAGGHLLGRTVGDAGTRTGIAGADARRYRRGRAADAASPDGLIRTLPTQTRSGPRPAFSIVSNVLPLQRRNPAAAGRADRDQLAWPNCSRIAGFSSVLVSCVIASPLAISAAAGA